MDRPREMSARSPVPKQLFHSSPYRLRVGTHLRPRWSPFQFQHGVWLTSSLVSARAVCAEILRFLREGVPGYCGTTYGDEIREIGRHVRGVWIYRVKATGPVERRPRVGGWLSAFPVRIMAVAGKYGEPERNDPPPVRRRFEADLARLSLADPPLEGADLTPAERVDVEREATRLRAQRIEQHRKLVPDARYRRAWPRRRFEDP